MIDNENTADVPALPLPDGTGEIPGYRQLNDAELALVARIKSAEEQVTQLCRAVTRLATTDGHAAAGRWASMARSQLETGYSYLVKAVTRPTNGLGNA